MIKFASEDEFDELNKAIRKWLRKTVNEIVFDMHAKGVRHTSRSASREAAFLLVRGKLQTKFAAPEKASVKFPRHLVFVKYGVGKYRPKGSGKEVPKDIIDNILEKNLPELADICTKHYADIVVRNIFIDKSRALPRF